MSVIEFNHMEGEHMDLIKIIKALSHQNRLRILNLINQQDLCVCELEYIMDVNQSNASRHLTKLKEANIIYGKRKAQWIYHQINEKLLDEHIFLKEIIDNELKNIKLINDDNDKLKKYLASGLSCEDLT
ncbi:MAG: metalloregulator ArsR/SmtB family transcription factor [Halanaerobiales bacterium]